MAQLILEHVSVHFPLLASSARSLKQSLVRTALPSRMFPDERRHGIVLKALSDINLTLGDGDRLALIGANGSGKSSLLRVMGSIYPPTYGKLHCQGRRRTLLDIHSGFNADANGYENIRLRGLLIGLSSAEIDAKVDDIARFSELGAFMHLPVRTYSSGMLLRLLFSIAVNIPGEIILMDEWLATGDRAFMAKAHNSVREFISQSRILVFASHDLALLRDFCNRAVLLERGMIIAEGSVDEVIEIYTEAR